MKIIESGTHLLGCSESFRRFSIFGQSGFRRNLSEQPNINAYIQNTENPHSLIAAQPAQPGVHLSRGQPNMESSLTLESIQHMSLPIQRPIQGSELRPDYLRAREPR